MRSFSDAEQILIASSAIASLLPGATFFYRGISVLFYRYLNSVRGNRSMSSAFDNWGDKIAWVSQPHFLFLAFAVLLSSTLPSILADKRLLYTQAVCTQLLAALVAFHKAFGFWVRKLDKSPVSLSKLPLPFIVAVFFGSGFGLMFDLISERPFLHISMIVVLTCIASLSISCAMYSFIGPILLCDEPVKGEGNRQAKTDD